MKIKPLNDRILVKRSTADERTPGGLYVPENAKEKPTRGEVLAVGPGKRNDRGERIPMDVKPGDVIYFGKYSGNEIEHEGQKVVIVNADDVTCVVE